MAVFIMLKLLLPYNRILEARHLKTEIFVA